VYAVRLKARFLKRKCGNWH